jgi:short-subunit dehydrogenase
MPTLDVDMKIAKDKFEANFFSITTIQAFSSLLIASRREIINIGSVGAHYISPYIDIYSATKATLAQMSKCLRSELAPLSALP